MKQVGCIITGLIIFYIGICWIIGEFDPEAKLKGHWAMSEGSWEEELEYRKHNAEQKRRYKEEEEAAKRGRVLALGAPTIPYFSPTIFYKEFNLYYLGLIDGRKISFFPDDPNDDDYCIENGSYRKGILRLSPERSYRVIWQGKDCMGLQDSRNPDGPIRWYIRGLHYDE